MTSIMICDDQVMFANAIIKQIETLPEVKVIGSAYSGEQCISLIEKGCIPEILLLDISMPNGISGYQVAVYLKKNYPYIKVIVISMLTDIEVIKAMIRLGAKGFLYKCTELNEIEIAINKIKNNQEYYPKDFSFDENQIEEIRNKPINWAEKITPKELKVLKLAAENQLNKSIASNMGISETAVNKKIKSLSKKTQTKSKIGIILFLKKVGIL